MRYQSVSRSVPVKLKRVRICCQVIHLNALFSSDNREDDFWGSHLSLKLWQRTKKILFLSARLLHSFPPLSYPTLILSSFFHHSTFLPCFVSSAVGWWVLFAWTARSAMPMASELWLSSFSLPSRLLHPSSSTPRLLKLNSPSSSVRCSLLRSRGKVLRLHVHRLRATSEQQGQVQEQEDEVVDSKILQYCSIDRKEKKSLGEMEQEFLQALQSFYYDKTAIMSNEEFDNLKEELMWEGSSVVMLSADEQIFLEASMAYAVGKPIMSDAEFDELKLRLKQDGSRIVAEGPRCSLRSRKVYSDLSVDYFKMFLLNVPAALVALILFFFLDDLTGFELTYLMELPEPFSFIFTWFAALPLIFYISSAITNAIVKDFLILKGPCPNCGTENLSFFGTILSIPSGGETNTVKCSNCSTALVFDSKARLITLPEPAEA